MIGDGSRAKKESLVPAAFPWLDRDDYAIWATKIEYAMEAHETWEAINPGGDRYKKGGTERKDRQAMTSLYSVIPNHVAQHMSIKTTADNAWGVIKTLHMGDSRVREANLQTLARNYESLRMEESESMDAFATRVVDISSAMKDLREDLKDVSVVHQFLHAAAPRYMQLVTLI